MACGSCGEKGPDNTKDFPRSVVEIHNPERLVFLRKVIVPASMGDESSVPAAIGKYFNVILQYEANNHVYIYSSDGIPTQLVSSGGEVGDLAERVTRLEVSDVAIRRELDTKQDSASLAVVATTGDYDDLLDKPTIPVVPTNVSAFTNDSDYQTGAQVSSAISTAIGDITGVEFEVVQTLPQVGEAGVIYLVPNQGTAPNIYDEYIYVNNAFEKIGTTEIDLSNYVTETELQTALATKADVADTPVITMTTTDPGEGSALAENHFIAVYEV